MDGTSPPHPGPVAPALPPERRALLALGMGLLAAGPAAAQPGAGHGAGHAAAPAGEGWFSAFGLRMRVELTSAATGGALSATRVVAPPRSGPPAHLHTREDEVFVILRGRYRFWQVGAAAAEAGPGEVVHLHKGVVHQYRNVAAEEGEHLLFCLPGGLEEMFRAVAEAGLVLPRDMAEVVAISARYGIAYRPPIDGN